MALFHFHVGQIKRSAGRSAVECAAYRAGERLYSEYYGLVSEYTRKGDTTTYNLDYDDESTSGTITVVVTGGKIVKIVVADDSGETTTTNYTFGAEAANAYTADEWQTLHPEQL